MQYIYKVDSFNCTFASRNKFNAQFQAVVDYYAADGWRLHSFQVVEGQTCMMVFEKPTEE